MTRSVSWIGFWSAIMLYWRYVEVLIFVCYFQYLYFNWTWKLRQQFQFQKDEKHHVDSALDEIKFWENPQRAYTQPQLSHWVHSLGCLAGFVYNVRVPTPGIDMLPSPLSNQPWLHVKKSEALNMVLAEREFPFTCFLTAALLSMERPYKAVSKENDTAERVLPVNVGWYGEMRSNNYFTIPKL